MRNSAYEVVAIAASCLGGLRGRSALLIGPEEQRRPYLALLQQAGMKYVYQEATPQQTSSIIPHIQLLISVPGHSPATSAIPLLTADVIAEGCIGRHTPLLIFDIGDTTSVEELAGLLPAICLYTPEDMHRIFSKRALRNTTQHLWQSQQYAS
jgi:hypothetical protein